MDIKSFLALSYIKIINKGSENSVSFICYDNRKAIKNSMFVAVKGFSSDGHKYIDGAIKNGAKFIVIEDNEYSKNIDKDIWVLKVDNSRVALAKLAAHFYNYPAEKMDMIGVTGTNGKTSISTYVYNYYKKFKNIKCGLIGTIHYLVGDHIIEAPNTTPESCDFEKLLADMASIKSKIVVSEVSSHALALNRVDGSKFKISAFTNLTRDHLDFHSDMEDYFNTKKKLFTTYLIKNGISILNLDDQYGQRLFNELKGNKISYSLKNKKADILGKISKMSMSGTELSLTINENLYKVKTKLIGNFNIENLLAVIGILIANGENIKNIIKYIKIIEPVKGRFQNITLNNEIHAIVDYAHTSDALKNILETVKRIDGGKVITIFGAGGDRDKGKRHLMAEISSKYSDISIVTNDNPRTENPKQIIDDILVGMSGKFEVIEDRSMAIKKAIELANSGDIIIVAGKGHEDYQIVGTKKNHFSDFEELEKWGKING